MPFSQGRFEIWKSSPKLLGQFHDIHVFTCNHSFAQMYSFLRWAMWPMGLLFLSCQVWLAKLIWRPTTVKCFSRGRKKLRVVFVCSATKTGLSAFMISSLVDYSRITNSIRDFSRNQTVVFIILSLRCLCCSTPSQTWYCLCCKGSQENAVLLHFYIMQPSTDSGDPHQPRWSESRRLDSPWTRQSSW